MKNCQIFLVGCFLSSLLGCRAQILQQDQSDMRDSLLELYKDQVMDNLIRTAHFKPVAQIDYKTMTGTVTGLTKGTINYGHESDRTSGTGAAHVVKLTPSIVGEEDLTTQLTVTGDPVTDKSIYLGYEQYLWGPNGAPLRCAPPDLTKGAKLQMTPPDPTTQPASKEDDGDRLKKMLEKLKDLKLPPNINVVIDASVPTPPTQKELVPQGILKEQDEEPAEGKYHMKKKWDKKWYYVPNESAGEFYALYKWVILNRAKSSDASAATKDVAHQLELNRLNQQLFR